MGGVIICTCRHVQLTGVYMKFDASGRRLHIIKKLLDCLQTSVIQFKYLNDSSSLQLPPQLSKLNSAMAFPEGKYQTFIKSTWVDPNSSVVLK